MNTAVQNKPVSELRQLISADAMAEIDTWIAKFPSEQRQSASLQTLRIIQDEHGWLSDELINAAAVYLNLAPISLYEVATFYSMYNLTPTQTRIDVCTNLTCMLRGSDNIVKQFEQALDVKLGETTSDGRFSLKPVECLGVCINAPVCQVNKKTYEGLDSEKVNDILAEIGSQHG